MSVRIIADEAQRVAQVLLPHIAALGASTRGSAALVVLEVARTEESVRQGDEAACDEAAYRRMHGIMYVRSIPLRRSPRLITVPRTPVPAVLTKCVILIGRRSRSLADVAPLASLGRRRS